MIEIENTERVRIVQYSITEWREMEENWVLVKGVADGKEFDGVLRLRTDIKRKSPV